MILDCLLEILLNKLIIRVHYTHTHTQRQQLTVSNPVVVIISQCMPYHIIRLYFFILATPHNMQDMSSPSREGNCAHHSGSVES